MKKRILTIEDSMFERKAIINLLRKGGYTDVIEAENGAEGVEKYKKEKPDLVLLDLRLPGEPAGLDVFRALKKINPAVKCIVVSIVRAKETMDEALKLGVKAYITKPVTEQKLVTEVKKVIG
ncbi:response regulator [Candidatus Woesearchaeota archaeon]|nr:response regulator [Candidatus Woesearchaeota archaeon]